MPLYNLMELLGRMPVNGRLLGLDPGRARIGVALSDVSRRIASPYGTLQRAKLKVNAAEIAAIAAKEGVTGLVIGLALNEDQKLGPAAQAARDWAHAVSVATGLPVAMQDESLTTADVHEMLAGEADVSRVRRGQIVDKMAAAAILQAALDTGK